MKILVTGAAGFIGSALARYIINSTTDSVVNVDKLTYAGNLQSLKDIENSDRYAFVHADICDAQVLDAIFSTHKPDAVMHLAAKVTLTVQSPVRPRLLKRILLEPTSCLKQPENTGKTWKEKRNRDFVSIIFQPMKCMGTYLILMNGIITKVFHCLLSIPPMLQAARTLPLKHQAII
jgi:hypothetical protein